MEGRDLQGPSSFQDLVVLGRNDCSAQGNRDEAVRDIAGFYLLIEFLTMAAFRAVDLMDVGIEGEACFRPALLDFEMGLGIRASYDDGTRVSATGARSAVQGFRLLRRTFCVVRRFLVELFKVL